MRVWFPFALLVFSVVIVIGGTVALFQPSVSDVIYHDASVGVRAVVEYGGVAAVFLPVVSLATAILSHRTRLRGWTIGGAALWLTYWVAILVLWSNTKGRI